MFKKFGVFMVSALAIVLLLNACGPTSTPEPTATPMPTSTPTATSAPDAADATSTAEPEPGSCELYGFPEVAVRPVDETDWVKGPADATVTIIEYSDFQCPGCSGMAPIVDALLAAHPEMRLVYRHFPLSFHPLAVVAAEAAEAAGAQGKFWEMYELLFGRVDTWTSLDEAGARAKFGEFAAELGLDVVRFNQELADHVYLQKVESHGLEAQELGLPGTPSFIYNQTLYPTDQIGLSYNGMEEFLQVIGLRERQYTELPAQTVDAAKTYEATVKTSKGDLVVRLLPDVAPVHVNSFVFLAQEAWYNNSDFFFVQDNYAAVTGDPSGSGIGYPGYYCTGELQGDFNRPGLVGMLPSGQFFFTLGADAAQLNGSFPMIGEVIQGQEVLDALARVVPGDPAASPPDVLQSVTIVVK